MPGPDQHTKPGAQHLDAYGQTIKSMVKTTDMNELQAATHAAKQTGGMAAVCYLAAFVEMTDPEVNECQIPPMGWRCTRSATVR